MFSVPLSGHAGLYLRFAQLRYTVQMSEKESVIEKADLLPRCGVISSVCPMRVWSQTRPCAPARCALRPERVPRVPPGLRSDTAHKIPAHQLF